jgi:fructuronate reductase
MLEVVRTAMDGVKLGEDITDMSGVNWILSREELFGVNLLEMGRMGDLIKSYLSEMITGPGAVRSALKKIIV